MTEPNSPVRNKNYNLFWILEASLHTVFRMEEYIQDAENAGDTELAEWFRKIQESNRKAGEQGKQPLAQRLQQDK